ncbi:hypothetical protein EV122DRAFT_212054 [Schizophyllum commune]
MEESRRMSARLKREREELQLLISLADQLCDIDPFPPGYNYSRTLKKLVGILEKPNRTAFSSLSSDPVIHSIMEQNIEVLDIIGLSFEAFGAISSAGRDDRMSSTVPLTSMRALWPHIIRWAVTLHPPLHRPTLPDGGSTVRRIIRAYFMMSLEGTPDANVFLQAHPVLVTHLIDLWLRFPQYISASEPDALETVGMPISLMESLHHILVRKDKSPSGDDRALFVNHLRRALGGQHTAYTVMAQHTNYLVRLPDKPAFMDFPIQQQIWVDHFNLMINLVSMPEFKRARIPGKAVFAVVTGATRCLDTVDTRECALLAVHLLDVLCQTASSNKALACAMEAGVFDVLRKLEQSASEGARLDGHIAGFIHFICAGLYQARVLRAFIRRHPTKLMPRLKPIPPTEVSWTSIATISDAARELYRQSHDLKEWKKDLIMSWCEFVHARRCTTARVAASDCTTLYIERLAVEKPGRGVFMARAISLDDTFFICSSTRFFIITAFSMIREQIIEALAPRRKAVKPPLVRQPVIFFDLTNILSGGRSQVYLRTSYMPDATPRAHRTILSEVALRAGKHSITKTIPLILDLEDFGISP